MTENAFNTLAQAAFNPVIVLCNHRLGDAAAIEELAPLGLILPEDGSGKWWEVSPAGYDFVEYYGGEVCRWKAIVGAW